ncbi:MAG TPA: hypothetical protein VN515_07130 [Terriglobales bacterium]|nr:hypothetical protein [Terriglobales bacterium]
MAKQEDAKLLLKLYDLRRETVMRQARTWFGRDFHPTSAESVMDTLKSEQSAYFRMVTSYWEMAATLVAHGAIDADLFNEANGEHIFVYVKMEPYLKELRTQYGNPRMMANLEKVVLAMPNAEATLKSFRERIAAVASAARR